MPNPIRHVLALAICLSISSQASAETVRWRASGSWPAGHSQSLGMDVFKKEVARLSKDTIRIDLFHNNTLGSSYEQVDQLRSNQIQLAYAGPDVYEGLVTDHIASIMPFSTTSSKELICQLDSDFGKHLRAEMEKKGLIVLSYGPAGGRNITNNKRPIKTLEDLSGLSLRIPPSETWALTFKALGASPMPLDVSELYQALQQGVVDGQENPNSNTFHRKFYEVQKHLSNSNHFYSWTMLIVNKTAFDGLKPEQQDIIRQAAQTASDHQRTIFEQQEQESQNALIKAGMVFTQIAPAELEKMRKATAPVYQAVRQKVGDATMDMAEKAINACRGI